IDIGLKAGTRATIGECPCLATVVRPHAADRRDTDPHALGVGVVGDDGMQAQPTGARLPGRPCWMLEEADVHVPVDAVVGGGPEAGWVDAHVQRAWLTLPSRLDDPDVLQLLVALLGELDAALGLAPCLAEVIAVAQKGPEKITIVCGKD